MIKYITETKIFLAASQTDTYANSVIFINTGSDAVNVDGLVLQPSQSFEITGNQNEILVKVYSFNFLTTTAPQLTVIYKRYLNEG